MRSGGRYLETSNGNPALHETFRNRLVYNQRFLKMSVVTLLLSPSLGRGTPEGQGVGRRRNRAKPTSGATRHLLPKEGGRSGMSNPSPLPREGDRRSVTTLIVRKRRGVYIGQCHFRASPYIYSRRSRHHKFESRDEWLGIRSKR